MGCTVNIKIKPEAVDKIANELKSVSECASIATENFFIEWAEDINTNPESPQKHLAPTAVDALKAMFGALCPLNTITFDIAFDRTPQEELDKLFEYLLENKDSIIAIYSGRDWFERSSQKEHFVELESLNDEPFKVQKNPVRREAPTGGVATTPCGFHLLYSKVKYPVIMKEDEFLGYRDNKDLVIDGKRFLLMPLINLDDDNQLNSILNMYQSEVKTSRYAIIAAMYSGFLSIDSYKAFLGDMTKDDIDFLITTGENKISGTEYGTRLNEDGLITVNGRKRKLVESETRCLEIGLNAQKDKFGTISA